MGQDVEEGRLVGDRYRLEGVLGRGGMGTVWRGRDETLGRPVAVKELRFPSSVDDDERQRLITRTRREAEAIARIRSGSAVTVFDVVDEDDRPWIVMELVEGCSLADHIRNDGPLTPRRAAEVGLAVLDVLRAAHREGILHRDVKPSNVLLEEGTRRVVLTDFGIAKVEGDPSITSTGMLVGAPSYISPERARGKPPGPPADLWSLGGLLYAAVEGRPPYDKGSALSTLTAVMTEPLPAPEKAGELTEVLHGLLEKNPEERLDVDGAHALLEAVASGAAAVPEAPDATRAVALPPTPEQSEDAGGQGPRSSRGEGARSGERLRGAWKSVRNAAATGAGAATAGSAGPAGPEGAEDSAAEGNPEEPAALTAAEPDDEDDGSRTGAVASGAGGPAPVSPGGFAPRKVLAAAAAVVALVLVVGAVITFDDDGGGGGTTEGGSSAGKAPGKDDSANDDPGKGDSGRDGGKPDEGGDSGGGAPDTGASDGTEGGGDDQHDGGGLPAGYALKEDSRFHFAMAMPEGFTRFDIAGTGSGGKYAGPDRGYPRVQVDYTSSPGDDAKAAWEAQEPVLEDEAGYRRVRLETIEWRDYPTVADWVFEYEVKGTRVRALNRGFRVDGGRGHSIMVTCKAAAWDGKACRTLRKTAFRTFEPR